MWLSIADSETGIKTVARQSPKREEPREPLGSVSSSRKQGRWLVPTRQEARSSKHNGHPRAKPSKRGLVRISLDRQHPYRQSLGTDFYRELIELGCQVSDDLYVTQLVLSILSGRSATNNIADLVERNTRERIANQET